MTWQTLVSRFLVPVLATAALAPVLSAQLTLTTISPPVATPGLTTVTLTGSGFPAGNIVASNISVTLAPKVAGTGSTATVPATTVVSVLGTIRRVTFPVPSSIAVSAPTQYVISLQDTTDKFSSANTLPLAINPPAAIPSVTPASGTQGQTVTYLRVPEFPYRTFRFPARPI